MSVCVCVRVRVLRCVPCVRQCVGQRVGCVQASARMHVYAVCMCR